MALEGLLAFEALETTAALLGLLLALFLSFLDLGDIACEQLLLQRAQSNHLSFKIKIVPLRAVVRSLFLLAVEAAQTGRALLRQLTHLYFILYNLYL